MDIILLSVLLSLFGALFWLSSKGYPLMGSFSGFLLIIIVAGLYFSGIEVPYVTEITGTETVSGNVTTFAKTETLNYVDIFPRSGYNVYLYIFLLGLAVYIMWANLSNISGIRSKMRK